MNFNSFWSRESENLYAQNPELNSDEGLNDEEFCKIGWNACKKEVLKILNKVTESNKGRYYDKDFEYVLNFVKKDIEKL